VADGVPAGTDPERAAPLLEWVRGDLRDASSLAELVRGADTVVHCAGAVRGSSVGAFDEVNVRGTARLAEAAGRGGEARRFLLVSSLAAREPGLSWYASSKRRGEEALARIAGDAMAWTVLRPTAVYGPGDREMRPLSLTMQRGVLPVLGAPDGRVSLLHVEDMTMAVAAWMRSEAPTGVLELHDGTPEGYTWREVARIVSAVADRPVRTVRVPAAAVFAVAGLNLMIARALGSAPMLTPGKVRELRHADWSCSNGAATAALGWRPRIDLETALRNHTAFEA